MKWTLLFRVMVLGSRHSGFRVSGIQEDLGLQVSRGFKDLEVCVVFVVDGLKKFFIRSAYTSVFTCVAVSGLEMVVSQNKGTPMLAPKYYTPYYGDLKIVPLIVGTPPMCIGRELYFYDLNPKP